MLSKEDKLLLEKWFLFRNISSGTQESYLRAMKIFTRLVGKSISELYQEAKEENLSQIEVMERGVTLNLLKFKKHLKESGRAPGTVNLYYSAICSFYRAFQISLPVIKMDKGDIGLEKNMGRRLDREDILKMIGVAPARETALIYLMAMSGMGQREARDLKINKFLEAASQAIRVDLKDVEDLFKHEEQVLEEVLTLHLRRKKVNYNHITFIPPEASRAIINYLKERYYGPNKKTKIRNTSGYIFINYEGRQLTRDSIVTNFRNLGYEAGFEKEKGSYSYWRSHALRKYFISKIINKSGDKIIADYMAGHSINSQDRTYWEANPDDLKKLYFQALPHLSIDQVKVSDLDSEEIKELKEDSKEKDKTIKLMGEQIQNLYELYEEKEFGKKHMVK